MAKPHQVSHGWMHGRVFRLKRPVDGFTQGQLVKVVMVSYRGCGVTTDLQADHDLYTMYQFRVDPDDLEVSVS